MHKDVLLYWWVFLFGKYSNMRKGYIEMEFKLYKAKTKTGKMVIGNLVYSKDVEDEFKAIIIPVENNGQYTQNDDKDLGFEEWYQVDINSVEIVE